ncbi:hypothetical protein CU098_012740 [Rhizopus stolonifer]|uniref:Uncharacterized protein n=2 Tax=Mucorineae TaxID=1344963 RepID=A0A367KUV0_RHIST|nr:hypothetical protein CU098_012740 [Rhizopus stolonifer]
MKFSITLVITALFSAVSAAEVTMTDGQVRISSPISGGVYNQGKTLPFTYKTIVEPLNVALNMYLRGTDCNYPETILFANADVFLDSPNATPIHAGPKTYYEHSLNYIIPSSLPTGNYAVTYQNTNTGVNTTIPIYIQPS